MWWLANVGYGRVTALTEHLVEFCECREAPRSLQARFRVALDAVRE